MASFMPPLLSEAICTPWAKPEVGEEEFEDVLADAMVAPVPMTATVTAIAATLERSRTWVSQQQVALGTGKCTQSDGYCFGPDRAALDGADH